MNEKSSRQPRESVNATIQSGKRSHGSEIQPEAPRAHTHTPLLYCHLCGHNHSQDEGDRVAKRSQSHVRSLSCVSTDIIFDGAFSKKLQFSTLTAQDVVRISEFQVTHRDLYTTTDRAPVKDGVLDRRLVSRCLPLTHSTDVSFVPLGYFGEERVLRDLRAQCG